MLQRTKLVAPRRHRETRFSDAVQTTSLTSWCAIRHHQWRCKNRSKTQTQKRTVADSPWEDSSDPCLFRTKRSWQLVLLHLEHVLQTSVHCKLELIFGCIGQSDALKLQNSCKGKTFQQFNISYWLQKHAGTHTCQAAPVQSPKQGLVYLITVSSSILQEVEAHAKYPGFLSTETLQSILLPDYIRLTWPFFVLYDCLLLDANVMRSTDHGKSRKENDLQTFQDTVMKWRLAAFRHSHCFATPIQSVLGWFLCTFSDILQIWHKA